MASLNNHYAIRARQVGYPVLCVYASSAEEALEVKQRIESERRRGLIIDYGLARRTTFADLLIRYLREEAPRHKPLLNDGLTKMLRISAEPAICDGYRITTSKFKQSAFR